MMEEGVFSSSNHADVLTMQNLDDTNKSVAFGEPCSPEMLSSKRVGGLAITDMTPFESHASPTSQGGSNPMLMT